MSAVELVMPKMGESIMEATILKWTKKVGDSIKQDETILEIATDKVDSEVPSPVAGVLQEIKYPEGAVVEVDKVIALIAVGSGVAAAPAAAPLASPSVNAPVAAPAPPIAAAAPTTPLAPNNATANRFYSPLVLNIAREEGIAMAELENIAGSGKDNRVTKKDILDYVAQRSTAPVVAEPIAVAPPPPKTAPAAPSAISGGNVEIIEMDRMRRLIADHMVMSKHTSPHVTSFVEADVTEIVNWRQKVKNEFWKRENTNLTFTPIFVEAVVRAIKDFPRINSSVDGYNIIQKKDINIGIATALPSGNLIVPVLRNADRYNLVGLAKALNEMVEKARNNKLTPSDIQDGTFTLSNVGTFGNIMGTPIINQPQVAILAVGAVRKMPAVLETKYGDVIAIRQKMFLSLSYDHRIVDGALGGSFLRRVADYLEEFTGEGKI